MNKQSGFTLLELLVGMSILTVLMLLALTYSLNTNRFVRMDSNKVSALQNLQGAMSIMTADIKQAGENLDLSLGFSGLDFNNSTKYITVRKMIPALTSNQTSDTTLIGQTVKTMNLCDISGNMVEIVGPPRGSINAATGCTFNASPIDSEDVNVRPWRAYFASQGGIPQAAILSRPATSTQTASATRVVVNSINDTLVTTESGTVVRRTYITLDGSVPSAYSTTNGSTISLVDERRYLLNSSSRELKLALGGQTDAQAGVLAFNITDMNLSAVILPSTSGAAESTVDSLSLTGPWSRIKSVGLSLTGTNPSFSGGTSKTLSTDIFPRNVESAQ